MRRSSFLTVELHSLHSKDSDCLRSRFTGAILRPILLQLQVHSRAELARNFKCSSIPDETDQILHPVENCGAMPTFPEMCIHARLKFGIDLSSIKLGISRNTSAQLTRISSPLTKASPTGIATKSFPHRFFILPTANAFPFPARCGSLALALRSRAWPSGW